MFLFLKRPLIIFSAYSIRKKYFLLQGIICLTRSEIPVFLSKDDFMVINIDMEDFAIPSLLVARVRHKQRSDDNGTLVGVEFMVREDCPEKLPRNLIKNLPLKLFDFDDRMRTELASLLTEKYKNNME